MKGQYRIISELILFGVGIMITTFVIVNFTNVQNSVQDTTVSDQIDSVVDVVATAVVKAANMHNGTIRIRVPDQISGKIYRISIKDADGGKVVINTFDGAKTVERQLFNMNYDNIVASNNIINNSEVTSTARFIEIVKNEKITIRRMSLNTTVF